MINLNIRTKNKILKVLKEEYKKSFGDYADDCYEEENFNQIHNLGDDELSLTQIHLAQTVMELFGINVTAYNHKVKELIEQSELAEQLIKEEEEKEREKKYEYRN